MTHRLRCHVAALACLAGLAGPVQADDDHISKITTDAEFAAEAGIAGMHLPGGTNLTDFAEASREPGTKGNETPGEVRMLISDLKDLKLMTDYLEPKDGAKVDKQIQAAHIRLEIAEKRQQRDALKKKKKVRTAEIMDHEIHALKAKLEEIAPQPKSTFADLFKPDDDH